MQVYAKRSLAAVLIVIMLLSLSMTAIGATTAQPTKYSTEKNSGQRDVVCTTLNGTGAAAYYTGGYTYDTLSKMSESELLSALRTLMTSTHRNTTSYDDCKTYSDETDCQNEDGTVLLLYTSYVASMADFDGSSPGWNREHVWPKSLGGFETSGAGADLHHIRPDNVQTNSTRGNKLYGNVTSGSQAWADSLVGTNVSGGTYSSSYFEPHDNVKGDVARICLYVYARWGGSYSKCSNIKNVFQSVDVLLEWCELDPVDTWEMGRNEVVGAIQGNRNVFIDYPEYAWLLFGKEVPDTMVTPSGMAMSSGSTGSTTCKHSTTEVIGAIGANCSDTGYTGDVYCTECDALVTKGTVISTTEHSFGEWVVTKPATVADAGERERTCEACTATQKEAIPKLDAPPCEHTETEKRNAKTASCTETGYTGDMCCTACDAVVKKGTVTLMLAHSFGEWSITKPATTAETGVRIRTCSGCSSTQTEIIPIIDPESCKHETTELREKLDATCTDIGYSGDTFCVICGTELSRGEDIPAQGHSFGEWETVTPASTESIGVMRRTCSGCEHYEENVIPRERSAKPGTVAVIAVAAGGTVSVAALVVFLIIRKRFI